MNRITLALVLVAACSAPPSEVSQRGLSLFPIDDDTRVALSDALDGIEEASGVRVPLSDAGTPVGFASASDMAEIRARQAMDAGHEVPAPCAVTIINLDGSVAGIWLDPNAEEMCPIGLKRILQHELIHAVRHSTELDQHSASGVFREYVDAADCKLDAASLDKLCEAADCLVFNPER